MNIDEFLDEEIDLPPVPEDALESPVSDGIRGFVDSPDLPNILPEPLRPFAGDFIEAGREFNLNPRTLAAISMLETDSGRSRAFRHGNNAMGISDRRGPVPQLSVRDSIFKMARTLSNPNGPYAKATTLDEYGAVYAPPGAGNDFKGTNSGWASGVRSHLSRLNQSVAPDPSMEGQGDNQKSIDAFLDEPKPFDADSFLDEPANPLASEIAQQEGQKASLGALQALDVMAAPRQLDWSDVNEKLDQDRFYESESLRAQARLNPEQAPELLAQSESLKNQITPQTSTGQRLLQSRVAENELQRAKLDTMARELSTRNPIRTLFGPAFQSILEPTVDAAAQQAGPAVGGALAAASFIHPGVGAFRAAIPLIAGYGGAIMGGSAQEMALRATETDQETQDRQMRWADQQRANPGASLVGGAVASTPFFGLNPGIFSRALQGERAALTNIGASAGIGGGAEAISQIAQGNPLDMRAIAMSAVSNAVLSEPTALGRRMGFPGSPTAVADMITTPKGPAREVLTGSPRVESLTETFPVRQVPERAVEAPIAAEVPPEIPQAVEPEIIPEALQSEAAQPEVIQEAPVEVQPEIQPEIQPEAIPESAQIAEVPAVTETTPLAADELRPTSNKEVVVNAERAARGLDPIIKEAKISNPASMEMAETAIDQNPKLPQEIVARLRTNPQDRSISVKDSAVLLIERTRLNNERNQALQRASDESLEPFERAAAQEQFKDIEGQLNNLDQAAQDARSTWGRFGQLWQRSMNSDYSLEALPARARVAKGEPLTEAEAIRVQDISKEVTAAEQAETKILEDRSPENVAVDNVIQSTPVDPAVKSIADRIIARMDVAASNAAKSLKSRLSNLGSAPDPLIILDVARIAAAKTAKGAVQFAQWSAEMIKEFGEKVRPFLQAGWDQREQHIDAEVNALGGSKKREAKARIAKTPTEQLNRIDAAIGNRIKEGADVKTLGPYVRKLAEQYVKSGIGEREALIDVVHQNLQSKVQITREQARDLISGYGESTQLSKDPNKVVLRDLKGQMQQIAKLEALEKKLPLQKTGPERRTPSAEERRLIKEVNEAKKKFGVVVTDPATQLKSTLDSARTRLRNEIEDLSLEIETGERPPEKTPVEYTQDIDILRGIRDRIRETLKEIDGPKQITDEQRIAASKRGLEASISALERRIGGEQPKTKKNVTTPEIEALKAKRDSLKAQLEEVEAADSILQEERKAEALVRSIEKAESNLTGNAAKAKVQGADTQLVAEAKQQLQALREQISKRREADPQRQVEAIEKAEQALEKNIAKLSSDIESGSIDVKSRKPGPQSQRLEYLRAQRDALTKLRTQLRNEARPRLTAEQAAIKARKSYLARRESELLDRIAKEDFGPRPRKEPINPESDPDLLDAQVRTNEAKAKFLKLQEEWRIKNLTGTQKFIRGVKQTWDASRNLWLSMDLSAPLQTAFAMAAHPIEGVKAIGKGFRVFGGTALGMDAYAKRVEQQIRNNPNNKNGLYRRMKLDLSDVTGDVREENMGSVLERLADLETRWQDLPDAVKGLYGLEGKKLVKGAATIAKLPLKTLGLGLKASNAGFGAIANHMRSRTADAILARAVRRRGEGSLNNDFLELIGNQVNAATGKGGLQGESGLRSLLFAPNYYLSIIKQLSGQPFWKAVSHHNKAAVREITEEYVRATLTAASVLGLAYLFSDRNKFTLDPRSKDFGKAVTDKGTTIDITMGRGAYGTLAAQWISGQRKDAKGKVHPQERLSAFLNFVRGRLSREITTASTTMFGKDFRGRDKAMKDLATEMVTPLSWREFDDILKKEGLTRGSFLQILNFLGINAKTSD